MKRREYSLYAKKIKITTLFNNLSPLRQRSVILENIPWTQTANAFLCQPYHKDMLFSFKSKCRRRIHAARLTQHSIRYLRPGDILQNGATLTQRRQIVEWSRYFYFLCVQKVFSSLHNSQMADGLFWQCFSYFSGPWQCYLAVNGIDISLPVFIQNILICVLKTNKAFTGLELHGGKWLMTKFSFWGGVTL